MTAAGVQWRKPEGELAQLDGQPLGRHHLMVLQGPRNPFGAIYCQLSVADTPGPTAGPALLGLLSRGPYPDHNWVEVLNLQLRDLDEEELLLPLFSHLSSLVPRGGHMMVEYEGPSWATTREALALGIPPILTPLGQILRETGYERVRDWHIAEGGLEGPTKLIGYKPFDPQTTSRRRKELEGEMKEFLARPAGHHPLEKEARGKARQVLDTLP
jgi:hypothetical protein